MPDADVSITIPVDSRFVALVRVTTASLATELDFSIDDVDEATVGANELVALLIEHGEESDADAIELRFTLGTDSLRLVGRLRQPGATGTSTATVSPITADPLAVKILDAVVSSYEFGADTIVLRKDRTLH